MKLKKKKNHGEKIQDKEYHKEYKMKLKKDARQRVLQRVQNETEDKTEPIIFYLHLIKFYTKKSLSHTFHNLPSFLTARLIK